MIDDYLNEEVDGEKRGDVETRKQHDRMLTLW
jgi:hypothetical protein